MRNVVVGCRNLDDAAADGDAPRWGNLAGEARAAPAARD